MELDQGDLMLWLITVVIPLALTVLGVYQKTSSDKQKHEGRMVLIEAEVKSNKEDISELKTEFISYKAEISEDIKKIGEDLKLLHTLMTENKHISKTLEKIEKKLEN
ncbi:DUF7365 family protein [Macrococcus armenti]|uniref:DUF7365 family protein n=1 Tax=Macrococcus armenti TaxID=2875764 RepID=UPI001CCD1813|nr:hypothetical protein [Macrococcus armenti]UBH07833.1 hypothetical protein LAU41_07305 [Macrococcus armenti]UBH12415.1 hypothetical protein LAU43_07500 [Macrococcus armenti]